jgi:hypothetical protein
MCICLHVKHPLFCRILMELEFSRQTFEKYPNIKFYENLSPGSRVPWDGRTDTNKNITRLIVAFRNVAYAPKVNEMFCVK